MNQSISSMGTKMHHAVCELQTQICSLLNEVDTQPFITDIWERPNGGGGTTKILQDGKVLEKSGVNTSCVFGSIQKKEQHMFEYILNQQNKKITSWKNAHFYATGLSIVIHPLNPLVPTTHANYRYFEMHTEKDFFWWFGGGTDLTPYYLFEDDAIFFHHCQKKACDKTDPQFYPKFKKACDTYFYIPHREETRGIGGIFYDHLNDRHPETLFTFSQDASQAFIEAYLPILKKNHTKPYTESQKKWQLIRRGRYVEFNLLYDRGTQFGLATNGRIESIFMSLPKHVSWEYSHKVLPETEESKLLDVLKKPRDWLE